MDIRALRYSLTIARLGSFTKAAEELHVAQPALSVSVKKLEDELGVMLFVRNARRVVPTIEGQILLKRAERIFEEIDSARREIEDTAQMRTGEVRVGIPPMYGIEHLPRMLKGFHAMHPGVTITVTEGSADRVGRLLDDGEIDLAMLELRRVRPDWKHVVVGEEEMVLSMTPSHALAGRRRVTASQLIGVPMALFDSTFLQREIFDKFCARGKIKPNVFLQSNSVPLIRKAALDGLGVATLLRSLTQSDPTLVAVSFDPPEIMCFCLCWRNDRYLSKANRSFVEYASDSSDSPDEASALDALVETGQ